MCSRSEHSNNAGIHLAYITVMVMLFCVSMTRVSSNDQDITNSVHSPHHPDDQGTTNDINSGNYAVDDDDVISTFRLLKYRDVYTLAKKRLHNPAILQDLAKKLKKMDKAEMMYKRQRDTGMNNFSYFILLCFYLFTSYKCSVAYLLPRKQKSG